MTHIFSLSGTLFFLDAILMAFFCHNRFWAHRHQPANVITFFYFIASFFITLALIAFGLPSMLTDDPLMISIGGIIGLILNGMGFSAFLLIPLYTWLPPRFYALAKYIVCLYVVALAALVIISPPHSYLDSIGIIHWQFNWVIAYGAVFNMVLAFLLNIFLLGLHFYRLKKLSGINGIMLILTFVIVGLTGGYQYLGDNAALLTAAGIGLYIGVSMIFYIVIHGSASRVLVS